MPFSRVLAESKRNSETWVRILSKECCSLAQRHGDFPSRSTCFFCGGGFVCVRRFFSYAEDRDLSQWCIWKNKSCIFLYLIETFFWTDSNVFFSQGHNFARYLKIFSLSYNVEYWVWTILTILTRNVTFHIYFAYARVSLHIT